MKKIILTTILIFSMGITSYADHNAKDELTLGFMPYLASQLLLKKYQPLADYLTKKLNKKVVLTIAKDYNSHLKATGEDKLDISFLGGSPYVVVVDKYGKKPLLARYEFNNIPHFRSVIFTSKNSKINSLAEMKGKNFVFGSRRSTLSTQVPLYMLMSEGVKLEELNHDFLNNQENVYISVLLGEHDGGSASEEVFRENESKGLKAIAFSPFLSTHVFVTSSKMEISLQEKIKKALLELSSEPGGKEIIKSISPILTGFVDVRDSDYNLLRGILKQVLPVLE